MGASEAPSCTQEAAHNSEALFLIGNTAATAHQPRRAKISGVVRSPAGLLRTLEGNTAVFYGSLGPERTQAAHVCLHGLIITTDVRDKCESKSAAAPILTTGTDA